MNRLAQHITSQSRSLNEVRPGRPEQCKIHYYVHWPEYSLNEVRPGRPEQYDIWGPGTEVLLWSQ